MTSRKMSGGQDRQNQPFKKIEEFPGGKKEKETDWNPRELSIEDGRYRDYQGGAKRGYATIA